ncbi:SAM-dependent methyltransferase [Nonomuraea endophytica]|uniref:SAM-dependent methyltransferase n=1 Tax=Nonomuraea endophytica TaxID=714136 RepID=UPI0037C83FEC
MTHPFPPVINTGVPNAARVYDYLLGGKEHFAADREAAEKLMKIAPGVEHAARENRDFLRRAVAYLAELGYWQFIDFGSGLPSTGNVHEVAREIRAEARVAYIDNDPVVVTHGRALLEGHGGPGVVMIEADVREPIEILSRTAVKDVLDLTQPVVALMVAVLHFVSDDVDPAELIACLRDRLAPGSCLVLSHACHDKMSPEAVLEAKAVYARSRTPIYPRSQDEIAALLSGDALHEPGLVEVSTWRPRCDGPSGVQAAHFLGAVADLRPMSELHEAASAGLACQ